MSAPPPEGLERGPGQVPTDSRALATGFWEVLVGWFLHNKLIVFVLVGMLFAAGMYVAPFDWRIGALPRNPVPVSPPARPSTPPQRLNGHRVIEWT